MLIDITTHPAHDNSGYSYATEPLAILFDYVDADADAPMLAILYPAGLPDATYCDHGHDLEPGQPVIDVPDRTSCTLCPTHFHAGALALNA